MLKQKLTGLDTANMESLKVTGAEIRRRIREVSLPVRLVKEITDAYNLLCQEAGGLQDVAVRSSATAETCLMQALQVSRSLILTFVGWTR
jgi:phosphoenolpyruvate synthase/pyruvate phosphate dikinase